MEKILRSKKIQKARADYFEAVSKERSAAGLLAELRSDMVAADDLGGDKGKIRAAIATTKESAQIAKSRAVKSEKSVNFEISEAVNAEVKGLAELSAEYSDKLLQALEDAGQFISNAIAIFGVDPAFASVRGKLESIRDGLLAPNAFNQFPEIGGERSLAIKRGLAGSTLEGEAFAELAKLRERVQTLSLVSRNPGHRSLYERKIFNQLMKK